MKIKKLFSKFDLPATRWETVRFIFYSLLLSKYLMYFWVGKDLSRFPISFYMPEVFLQHGEVLPIARMTLVLSGIVLVFLDRFRNLGFLLVGLEFTLDTMRTYSSMGAFYQTYAVICFFLALFYGRKEATWAARITLFLIFFNGGLLKINSTFLAGHEFNQGAFAINSLLYYPSLKPFYDFLFDLKFVPWFVIFFEMLIGILFLIRLRLALFLFSLFTIGLSLLAPAVLFVWFILLPFVFMADENFFRTKGQYRYFTLSFLFGLTSYFLVFHKYLRPNAFNSLYNGFNIFTLSIFILSLAFLYSFRPQEEGLKSIRQNPRLLLWLGLLVTYLALPHLRVLPTPLGFSMFSSIERDYNNYRAIYFDRKTCETIKSRVSFGAWNTKISMRPQGCIVQHPTYFGILVLKHRFGPPDVWWSERCADTFCD